MGDWQTLFERLVVLVFCGAGLCLLFLGAWRLFVPNRELGWAPVNGKITESGVDEDSDDDGTIYSARIQYQYHYHGINYINDRIAPLQIWSSVRWTAESYARKYPRGREVIVFVNPQNPGKSVLEPDRQIVAASCCMLVGVVLCGIAFMYSISG